MIQNSTMLNFVSANIFTQMTNTPTRNNNILDLTLKTNPDLIIDLEIHPGMSDVHLTFQSSNARNLTGMSSKTGKVNQDIGAFRYRFLSEDHYNESVNRNWNQFKEAIVSSI